MKAKLVQVMLTLQCGWTGTVVGTPGAKVQCAWTGTVVGTPGAKVQCAWTGTVVGTPGAKVQFVIDKVAFHSLFY